MRMRLKYEDLLVIFFLAGVTAGTAAVNLMGVSIQEEAGYVGRLFASAAEMGYGYGRDFFMAVFRQRIFETAILWFISVTVFSERGFCAAAFYGGLSSSAVLSVMVCQRGVFGPFCYLAAVMPQYLFYIPSWLLAAAAGERHRERFPLRMAAASFMMTAAGIAAEVFLNPILVHGMANLR